MVFFLQDVANAIPELTGKAPESPTDSLAGTTHSLHLQTAYYTTTVPVWLDTITSSSEWSSSFLSPEAKEVLSVIGGVLVVFAIPQSTTGEKAEETKGLIRDVGRVVKGGLGGWDWDGVGVAVGVGEGTSEGDGFWDEVCGDEELEFVRVGGRAAEKNEFGGLSFLHTYLDLLITRNTPREQTRRLTSSRENRHSPRQRSSRIKQLDSHPWRPLLRFRLRLRRLQDSRRQRRRRRRAGLGEPGVWLR